MSNKLSFWRTARRGKQGVALLITLFCVALVSVVIVGFLAQATLNRQISFSSSGQARAQLVGFSALNTIVGDFRDEIAAGSTVDTQQGITLYTPTSANTVQPKRNTAVALGALFRTSQANTNAWFGTGYSTTGPIRATSDIKSSDAAISGRTIDATRWNKPLFFSTLPGQFASPNWLLITRQGPVLGTEPTMAQLIDPSPANNNYGIGRYAYTVYDEGSMLDVNVAGNPLPSTKLDNAKRGRLAQADLSQIPGVLDATALLNWRNSATTTSTAGTTNWIMATTNGFLTVSAGDQTFFSRQDLIKYVQDHSDVITTAALTNLTTFTREKNSPSYSPGGSLVNATNVAFARTRASNGTLLVKQRFPLSRLGLIGFASTGDTTTDIYRYFGLTRTDSSFPWVYNHGSASAILTLAQVAALLPSREPDFFELMKASILLNSLGKTAGDPSDITRDTTFLRAAADSLIDLQIIAIGAAIIDQYDADSYPTAISFTDSGTSPATVRTTYGIENLPYINRIFNTPYLKPGLVFTGWNEFEMWNPHQNPSATFAAGSGPTSFRIVGKGSAYAEIATTGPTSSTVSATTSMGGHYTQFNLQAFNEPMLLSTNTATCDVSSGTNIVGIYAGQIALTSSQTNGWASAASVSGSVRTDTVDRLGFALQCIDSKGNYVTYQEFLNQRATSSSSAGAATAYFAPGANRGFYFFGDPRNVRFGGGYSSGWPANQTMRGVDTISPYPTGRTDGRFCIACPANSTKVTGWVTLNPGGNPLHFRLSALANNNLASSSRYTDPDGVLRWGDGGLDNSINPFEVGNSSYRPIILNRPFRSVAELGYAFRDAPWKTLDFFTVNSGDAGLLDVFSVDDAAMVAGKVNLNTGQTYVLQALLAGGGLDENGVASPLTAVQARQISRDLTNVTAGSGGPFMNKSELVTRFSSSTITTAYPAIKTQREGMIRSLAQAGSTRTWNLMIDVIAQAGRFPPTAKTQKDFVIEGERRYWLHVAIDRFTGEIVDQQLETVYE